MTVKRMWWSRWRKQWIIDNPPQHYICKLCGLPVHVDEVSLDHIKPTSKYPHLKFDTSNIRPTHVKCNSLRNDDYVAGEFSSNLKTK